MNQGPTASRQRGVALIMAILIVALATVLAVTVATDGYMDQRRTAIMMSSDQAFAFAQGAEALAADALLDDAKNSQVDALNEAWATPINLPLDSDVGTLQGSLQDLQGRFNINNLLYEDGTPNETAIAQFQRILELLNLDTKWAKLVVDWIDADNEQQFPDGAEDVVYSAQPVPYLAANMPITRTSELLALPNFGLQAYRKLEPYISALPIGTPLNVCTAPGVVLDSLSGTTVEYSRPDTTLTTERESGCFPTLKTLDNTLGNDSRYQQIKENLTLGETSNYFRANILVTLGTTEQAIYSTLYRSGDGRSRIILRSFGTP